MRSICVCILYDNYLTITSFDIIKFCLFKLCDKYSEIENFQIHLLFHIKLVFIAVVISNLFVLYYCPTCNGMTIYFTKRKNTIKKNYIQIKTKTERTRNNWVVSMNEIWVVRNLDGYKRTLLKVIPALKYTYIV